MLEVEDIMENLKNILLDEMQKQPPEYRLAAFAGVVTHELGVNVEPAKASSIMVLILHTTMRHPEWLQAVCKDQNWFKEMYTDEEYELLLNDCMAWYPLARRQEV